MAATTYAWQIWLQSSSLDKSCMTTGSQCHSNFWTDGTRSSINCLLWDHKTQWDSLQNPVPAFELNVSSTCFMEFEETDAADNFISIWITEPNSAAVSRLSENGFCNISLEWKWTKRWMTWSNTSQQSWIEAWADQLATARSNVWTTLAVWIFHRYSVNSDSAKICCRERNNGQTSLGAWRKKRRESVLNAEKRTCSRLTSK